MPNRSPAPGLPSNRAISVRMRRAERHLAGAHPEFERLIAAVGRLISMAKVGLPEPLALWLAYVISELVIPCVMVAAQYAAARRGA